MLITIDKLDKLGHDGVITELRDRGFPAGPVDALEAFFRRPRTMEYLPFGEAAIRKALPQGVDSVAVTELAAIGLAVEAARGGVPTRMLAPGEVPSRDKAARAIAPDETASRAEPAAGQPVRDAPAQARDTAIPMPNRTQPLVQFDPWLVRGMGYYTGAIFEVAHPSLGYSLGGGGRYDGMIGRFLGSEVPAAGFSLGFERLVDLVELQHPESMDAAALVYDADVPPASLMALKTTLLAQGRRITLMPRPKNVRPLLESLKDQGYQRFAYVTAADATAELDFREIG